MQATIVYELTEQAQRAAMRATGQSIARRQVMDIEVPAEDLDLFPVDNEGKILVKLSGATSWARALRAAGWAKDEGTWNDLGVCANVINPPLIEDYKRGLAIVAEQDAAEAELKHQNGQHNLMVTEAAYQALLLDPAVRVSTLREYVGQDKLREPADWWPTDHAALVAEVKRRDELDAAARRATQKAEEAAKQAKEQAKLDYIDTWVAGHSHHSLLQEQHKAGLLARGEALRLIADEAFELAGVPEKHSPVTCENNSCPCGVKDVDGIPTEVYAGWAPLDASLPKGTIVEFEKVRDCERDEDGYHEPDSDGAGVSYYTALVKLPVGPFLFERRIKIS